MKIYPFTHLTILWKILLSTSVAITLIFGLTGWIVLDHATRTTSQSVEDEVRASFQAYQSLWNSRAQLLSSVSLILSTMSDVRAAFSTGDEATIRDTAGELWSRISDSNAIFLVADPRGRVIASLGGEPNIPFRPTLDVVQKAAGRFPRQASGFMSRGGRLYHITVTPVFVQSGGGTALLDVLVAGYNVNELVVQQLKESTGGSEFLFQSQGRVIASTLDAQSTAQILAQLAERPGENRIRGGASEYAPLITPLDDIEGRPAGSLVILRSFNAARQRIAELRRDIILLWLASMITGLGITFVLARRIVGPVKELDRAAAEVARQNFDHHVAVDRDDELGRLAKTFNAMSASIRRSREDLIRQERISTIGKLATSIVHDLRNPLAAIYGGAEMLVDSDLSQSQVKRLSTNIYRASRRIQKLLQELVDVSGGKSGEAELCDLKAIAAEALDAMAATADAQAVRVSLDIPEDLKLPLKPDRIGRVFVNLIANAIEAMPEGGAVHISAEASGEAVQVEVRDTGQGIAPEIRDRLFQPFTTSSGKGGLGLGLALARQTVLEHGGDMWVASEPGQGACFRFRLPLMTAKASPGPR
jgi:signal transduction histidine kinase